MMSMPDFFKAKSSISNTLCDVFVSHSSLDFGRVRLIRNCLEEMMCRPLLFHLKCLEQEGGEKVFDLLKREIDAREYFILCDSENAKKSYWVQREMEYVRSCKNPFVMNIDDRGFNAAKRCMIFVEQVRRCQRIYLYHSRSVKKESVAHFLSICRGRFRAVVNAISDIDISGCDCRDGFVIVLIAEKDRLGIKPKLNKIRSVLSCVFVLRTIKDEAYRVLIERGVYLLYEDTLEDWQPIISAALNVHLHLDRNPLQEFSSRKGGSYLDLCAYNSWLGAKFGSIGYLRMSLAYYGTAHGIAAENGNEGLKGFYFINFIDNLVCELRGCKREANLVFDEDGI